MKLIKPSQISGEIMTLIEEADKKLVIVSPYCKFSDWTKFLNTIEFLKRKNTDVEFYVREGEFKTLKEVEKIGFSPIEVTNLHTKLYINEKYAIVSSMNLLTYSDMNSLDIAYKTQTDEEYKELLEYYERYLQIFKKPDLTINRYSELDHYKRVKKGNWKDYLSDLISKDLERNCNIEFEHGSIIIKCGNIYEAFISNSKKKNELNIYGVISGKEHRLLEIKKDKFFHNSGLKVTLKKGRNGDYDTAWHYSEIVLKSSGLNRLYKDDYNTVIQLILDFIINLQDFKDYCRNQK